MLNNKLSIASLIMLSAWGSLYAAEPAGRVLILQGAAVAVRGSQEVPLSRGVTVESGDLLKVAEGSSLQVRFTDESVVALRANSQYKIDDYKFSEKGDSDKSVFSLLKGGMRTITGLIGKRNPDNYQMRSTTATIGIRGTHFTAVNCASDCTNADGSKAEDGLYGGVTDGRIVVRNGAGETEFGRDQYFQVASNNALPVPLLAPPSFLRDKLDGMAKAGKGSQGKTAEAQASGSSSTSETTSPAPNSFAPSLSTSSIQTTYQPLNNPVVQELLIAPTPANSTITSGTWSYAYSEASVGRSTYGGNSSISSYTYGASNVTETLANYPMPAGFTYNPLTWYKSAFGPYTATYTDTSGTYTTTFTKSASVDTGAYTGTDGQTAHWGRYNQSESYSYGGVTGTSDETTHWVHGAAVTSLPTSGIFTFTHVGGTRPTDGAGNVGTLTSGGSWTVNFGSKTLYSASPVTWTMPNGVSYQAYISPGAAATLSTYSQTYKESVGSGTYTSTETGVNTINRSGTTGGSCSGNGCTMTNVVLSPQFGGANATGLGLGIATTATTSSGTQNTAQVRVYTR
jgi:hypothetical protein